LGSGATFEINIEKNEGVGKGGANNFVYFKKERYMERDITMDEPLMKAVQAAEHPLLGFQSVIMGVDYAAKRGWMDKNRLIAIEGLLRPYANVNGLKLVLSRRRKDVPPHLVTIFGEMLNKVRGCDPNMAELMYDMYFKIIYSVHFGEILPDYTDTIKKISDMATVANKMRRDLKSLIKQEEKRQNYKPAIPACNIL